MTPEDKREFSSLCSAITSLDNKIWDARGNQANAEATARKYAAEVERLEQEASEIREKMKALLNGEGLSDVG